MRVAVVSAVLLVAACVSLPAHAQSVDDLVARHIEARGGYDRIKAIQTIKITRTVATPFSNVKVIIYKKRPQLLRAEQTAPGQAAVPRGVNADSAWDVAQGQVVLRPGPAAAEAREIDADFDGLLVDWKAKGHSLTLDGREPLPGGDAFKLKLTTRSGVVRYIFLDATTYLERRQTGVVTLAGNRKETFVMDISSWRAVDGVQFAFNLDEDRTGPQVTQSFATYTEKVELNVPMEDALFAPPAAGSGGR
jgi:hypothetical protein